MSNNYQAIYRFEVTDPDLVDDLRELWRESVVDWDREQRYVCVESDPLAIEHFLSFYELCLFLETSETADEPSIFVHGPNLPEYQQAG